MLSQCGAYRYTLVREWDPKLPRVLWVLLNPSTADASQDDPTLRKGIGFSKLWCFGSLCFVNLFAYRATKPKDMKSAQDPVGPENDCWILDQAHMADLAVVAWGNHGTHLGRDREVLALLGHRKVFCLGLNSNGTPKHPLMLPYSTKLIPYPIQR